VKFQSDFCLLARRCDEASYRLQALLIDVCSEAGTHRLCCGRIAPRASCRSQPQNPGWSGSDARKKLDLEFVLKRLVVVSVTNRTVGLFYAGKGQFNHSARPRPRIHSLSVSDKNFSSWLNNVKHCL
jgi:hypothetical protein